MENIHIASLYIHIAETDKKGKNIYCKKQGYYHFYGKIYCLENNPKKQLQ